jgi:hypothetical protein
LSNGPTEPLGWQELYDGLTQAGLSKRRASQYADWIIRRGVEGSKRVVAYLPDELDYEMAALLEYIEVILSEGNSANVPGWRESAQRIMQFLTGALAGRVDNEQAEIILKETEQGRLWRLEHVGQDVQSYERAQLVRVINHLTQPQPKG